MFALCQEDKPENLGKYQGKYVAQKKYDGVRVQISYLDDKIKITNRRSEDKTEQFPDVIEKVRQFVRTTFILDGEIVGKDFSEILTRCHAQKPFNIKMLTKSNPVQFVAFDVINFNGMDYRGYPFTERHKILVDYFMELCPYHTGDIQAAWDRAVKENWEGIVLKKMNSFYTGDRTFDWIKIKAKKRKILEFSKYTENPAGYTCENDLGIRIQCAGKKGMEARDKIDAHGKVRIEVEYQEETESGKLRMPVCVKVL